MTAIEVREAQPKDRLPVQRMLELYQHDLSDIWDQDIDADGEFGYALDRFWASGECRAFVVCVDGHYAGFALVDRASKVGNDAWWMDQFFVLKKYRRGGIGGSLARAVFAALPGQWEVGQMANNHAAQAFWRRVICDYTGGDCVEHEVTTGWWLGVVQRFRAQVPNRDVPSPIDLRTMSDAVEWEAAAMARRPWRTDFFAAFATAISALPAPARRVLELGSGPGFLAEHLLTELPAVSYVALDFSPAMHQLAAARLGPLAPRASFVERSFREPGWPEGLGRFDAIVTHQAVHELRHKRHARGLHAQAAELLAPGGVYLVCDHFAGEGGMEDNALYMTVEEQVAALHAAGFERVEQLLLKGGLVLHRASGARRTP